MAPKFSKPKMATATSTMKVSRKMSEAMKTKPLKYASDFAGMGTWGIGIQKIAKLVPNVYTPIHVFSCDNARCSKKFINQVDPPKTWFNDIVTRDMGGHGSPYHNLDIYTSTFPCQGLSSAGLRGGAADPRTKLCKLSVNFIKKYQPKAFIMENVPGLATDTKHKDIWAWLRSELKSADYEVDFTFINSTAYVPQNRRRLYIVGIRKSLVRKNKRGMPTFPIAPPGRIFEIAQVVTTLPDNKWLTTPDISKANGLHYRNVINAYKKLDKSINPFTTHVIVDFQATERFTTHRVEEAPTLTFTRANQFGYWDSLKGGPLNVYELGALQGWFTEDFQWVQSGISKTQAAGMLGNGQTLPVAMDILAHVLFHSSFISYEKFIEIKDAMYAQWNL
jgi:DNA-cytosine methyltransferase